MPGKTLSEVTIKKQQEAEAKYGNEPTRLGVVEEQKEIVAQPLEETHSEPEATQTYPEPKEEQQPEQTEDLLTKLTMPGKKVTNTPVEPEKETVESPTVGLPQDLDVDKVKQLAENIFNSDYTEKKKKI